MKIAEKFLIKFDELKVGQTVWSAFNGYSEIKSLNYNKDYPINLKDTTNYTKDGKHYEGNKHSTLFLSCPYEQEVEPTESKTESEEWKPKRGDRVLVWNSNGEIALERIFLTEIEGAYLPIKVVPKDFEEHFLNGREFGNWGYKHMKPLPKEKTFKEKAIEIVNNRIKICQELIDNAANEKNYSIAQLWKDCKIESTEILKQLKELE